MSSDHTQLQGDEESRRAQELSRRSAHPPAELPGYDPVRFLGAGAYGEVWVAIDRNTGRHVAIKFYAHRGGLDWSLLSREVEKLVLLSADRYVVQLLEVGWNAEPPYYVMEYIEQGSLDDHLRREGTLAVPEAVILKPTALNDAEWAQMKAHPQAGVSILARFSTFSGLREAVLYHHERWDGKGYPEGLRGDAIPMGARILAICDSYDAMIRGDYAYGMGVPEKEAAAEIRRNSGIQFDPELVELFLGVLSGAPA